MATKETPRGDDGEPLCAWCGGKVRQGGVGRRRAYCGRTCREYAYRARRDDRLRAEAYMVGRADGVHAVSSTGERGWVPVSPVDETRAPVLPNPGDGWVRSPAVVDAQLRELEARRVAPSPADDADAGTPGDA